MSCLKFGGRGGRQDSRVLRRQLQSLQHLLGCIVRLAESRRYGRLETVKRDSLVSVYWLRCTRESLTGFGISLGSCQVHRAFHFGLLRANGDCRKPENSK